MKIGIAVAFGGRSTTPRLVGDVGRMAEERGLHSIWVPEHVVLFKEYASRYPYSEDGRLHVGRQGGVLEPFTALTWLAAHTSRIRLGTGVCLVPQRSPVYTAKQVANVDFLSRGRLDFGIGIGWLAEEFAALGVPWAGRAERTRDYVSTMKALWCEDISSFEGELYQLPPCSMYPKPVQKPHPPILFGGESDAALRRVADMGQGWYGFDLGPAEVTAPLTRLRKLLGERDRSPRDVRVCVSPNLKPCGLDELERYRDAGVDQVILPVPTRSSEDFERRADALANELILPMAGQGGDGAPEA